MGILAGLIGWVITGVLVSINLAGPAYRVTVPSCVLIATLHLKLKAEREANKTKKNVVSSYRLSRWSSYFSCFFIKREHQSSNDPNNSPKSGVEKLKNPSHKN
ncbi:flagellar biosynthesis protein FlgG [Helicobacter pylori]|uniref:flagellar biosynthesis protein FlgG n=1 Tax=Helicobacter pylori TaxID=210 RepID=UPI000A87B07C|nr:flagellar biosynthesis protein FlgG [Helicobacter pylori]